MLLTDLDLNKLSKLTSQQIDHVTCIECCKYYTVPTTAACGHSLCNSCWRGRRICASCGKSIEKKNLKLNIPLQTLTEHISSLSKTLEDLFNIKLDEYLLDSPIENQDEPNKNVKEWLASSQNQFSAPITNSTQSTQGQIEAEKVTSEIQVHSVNKRNSNHKEVIHIPLIQDDWDNIEEMPETDKNANKNQENVVGPMDIEPFEFMMDDEYNANNLRRSLRNKDNKSPNSELKQDFQQDKIISGDTNKTSEKSSLKVAKTWTNVKRMKKEFSKLNKKHRNKLNVSIEMCKKNINKIAPPVTPENLYTIEDNTPQIINNENSDELINNCDVNKKNDAEQVISTDSVKNNITNNVTSHKIGNENNELPPPKVAFVKKSTLIHKPQVINNVTIPKEKHSTGVAVNNDDIEITIKIGNTLTSICIKKKDNDVQLKINSDRQVQTSLGSCNENKNDTSNSKITINNVENTVHCENTPNTNTVSKINSVKKTVSKKNTASADTSTAQFEITKSIGEEMMKSLNVNQESIKRTPCKNILQENKSQTVLNKISEIPEDADLDIFDTDSIKEASVASIKSAKNTPSAILPSFRPSKTKTPTSDKRNRENDFDENLPCNKKRKITPYKDIQATNEMKDKDQSLEHDHVNDEDFCQILDNINTMEYAKTNMKEINKSQNIKQLEKTPSQISAINNSFDNKTSKDKHIEKYSENVFSMLDNESQILKTFNYKTQQSQWNKDSVVEKVNNPKVNADLDVMELCTPVLDEDSDKSVVEDTPQKTASFSKIRNKNESTANSNNITMKENIKLKVQNRQTDIEADIISLSDTVGDSTKNITVLETLPRPTLETPVTITKFVDQIKHKSTPIARKSLKFNNENSIGDVTMCPSSFVVAKTTQEKEFLSKAFEQSIDSECVRHNERLLKFCIAGSCLTTAEQSKVKMLCSKRNWTYVEKYTKDLTHLIVGVDKDNKAQRSVKYICAIASGKWIITYKWIEKCLQVNGVVDEEPFEALDASGEPGPRRSRLSKQKLFTGISFYCMPPFRVIDVNTLKDIIECSGGRVIVDAKEARASVTPSLMLAEPENTQEDRFIYLAVELGVVPINYEWVLNCLGNFSLEPIYELLLCPASLLPPVVAKWPPELISHDVE